MRRAALSLLAVALLAPASAAAHARRHHRGGYPESHALPARSLSACMRLANAQWLEGAGEPSRCETLGWHPLEVEIVIVI